MPDHPKCPKCGKEEFQIVEDVPMVYRTHEFVDGELRFECSHSEAMYDGCGGAYRYLECRDCCTRIDNVPFRFVDGGDPHGDLIEAYDHTVPPQIAIVCEGGLVRDVYCTTEGAEVEILDLDDMEVGETGTDEEVAYAEAEEKRISERHAEIIADTNMHCVY